MKGALKTPKLENEHDQLKQQVNWEEMHRNKSKIFGTGAKMLDKDSIGKFYLDNQWL